MSKKRVILADGARLLREMLHRVIDRADHLEVVQELPNHEDLPAAIETLEPEWVIVSAPFDMNTLSWINGFMTGHPTVGFIYISPEGNSIKMNWQTEYEEDLTNLSLKDFIGILEKDPQHT